MIATATAAERVIDKLEAVKSNGERQWIARCPAHADGNPSLSIRAVDGRVLLFCFAGCHTYDIASAIGLTMTDLFDSPKELEYRYDGGRVAKRYYKPDGSKGFSQANTTAPPELYKRAAVVAAVADNQDVYVCEGEEDVRAMESLGVVATTAPQGAGNWSKVDYAPLAGHSDVYVCVDRDEAGERRAEGLTAHLRTLGVTVAGVIRSAQGNDMGDHVAAGLGLPELVIESGTVTPVTAVTDSRDKEGGAELLDNVQAFLARFIAYPSPEAATAHTLWVLHAHLVDAFENTPRLAFLSPEPGSGKSRAMELTEALVPRPVLSVNSTVAYVFRKISDEAGLPTLLMDEIDAVFSGSKSDGNEDLRGLLNSGYRKGATAGRAAIRGKEIVTEEWPSYCAVALAGLNQLPDTLMTRSIVVNMKRRRHDQKLEPYRRRVNGPESVALYQRLDSFANAIRGAVSDAWPELPDGIEDRDADIWEPMLAIADAAGGHWPTTARDAAVLMVADAQRKPATLGIKLLADIRTVIGSRDGISTSELLYLLHGIETSPWSNIKGEAIDSRFLAKVLGKYDISTNNTIRVNGQVVKGYQTKHFHDAFERYLPAPVQPEHGYSSNNGYTQAEDDS